MTKNIIVVVFCCLIRGVLAGQTMVKKVKPSDTDPLITTFNSDSNYVYINSTVSAQNILLVHLPGSFGEPKRATLFGKFAADLGFHSIGLMYPNVPTVGSFCTNATNPACFEEVRREIVDGIDYSTDISIPLQESILSRTKKLILFLKANYPTENWGQYLDGNNDLIYGKIIFSGHSQGGGHAAIIAKYYPIQRAICFSSPKDWRNIPDAPPLWLSEGNWQTSAASIYCFNHVLDEHTNHQLEIWDSLGLNTYGLPANVDSFSTPYFNTRQLTTSYEVPVGDDHACTIQDNKTPKISGVPVFLPVWRYMLTGNVTTVLPNPLSENSGTLSIAPIPACDFITIELTDQHHQIKIMDHLGKCVMDQKTASGRTKINVAHLNPGFYFIQAVNSRKMQIGKIIKQ